LPREARGERLFDKITKENPKLLSAPSPGSVVLSPEFIRVLKIMIIPTDWDSLQVNDGAGRRKLKRSGL